MVTECRHWFAEQSGFDSLWGGQSTPTHRRKLNQGGDMASGKLNDKDLAEIHALAKQWGKIVVRRAFGDQGPGLDIDLDTMERIAVAAAAGLTAGALEEATAQQAHLLDGDLPCPTRAFNVH